MRLTHATLTPLNSRLGSPRWRNGARRTARPTRRGYMLLECLLYIAVLALVMGIAFSAFYRCLGNSRDLARNSEDILRTLRVGELWRADIREAVAAPRLVTDAELTACEIPKTNGLVVYAFAAGSVWRQEAKGEPRQVLPRVKTFKVVEDHGQRVSSWRWELELASRKKHVHLHPLFTFEAVPNRVRE